MSPALLNQKLQLLQRQGRLLSLDYEHGVYRIEILTPQGLRQRFRLEPGGGLVRELTQRGQLPQGLLPLETLLTRLEPEGLQLLEAELEFENGLAVYELKWLQRGQVLKARYDARTGTRLAAD